MLADAEHWRLFRELKPKNALLYSTLAVSRDVKQHYCNYVQMTNNVPTKN